MNVTETIADGLRREFKVVVPAKQLRDRVEVRLKDQQRTMRLPGFRPGKVPMNLVDKHWRQHVTGEEVQRTIGDTSAQIVTERGLRPAGQPKVEITNFADGADLEYKLALDLLPDIEPGDPSKLELERTVVEIPEAEVTQALERLAREQGQSEPVAEPKPAETGDILVIDFVGRIDGKEFQGGTAEGHYARLGSGMLIPGFEDQLVGAMVGAKRQVNVTFPTNYPRPELAGKPAVFDVAVKEQRRVVPSAVDDALARSLGLESLEALTKRVREQLETEYKVACRLRLKRQLLDKLAASYDFAVPPTLLEDEFNAIWRQIEADLAAGRLDPEDKDKSEDELKAEYRAIATRRVRLGLLLSEIGRRSNVEIKQDELARAMTNEARRYPGQESKVIEFYQNHPEAMAQLRAPLYEDKVVDYIIDAATVSERRITPEQFAEELKQDNAA
ncbi:MAG TPA: trigger factor [Candidatus Udaeobacter sp.]|nr:trigger factor [Candidatus Udaeobacter sp.]